MSCIYQYKCTQRGEEMMICTVGPGPQLDIPNTLRTALLWMEPRSVHFLLPVVLAVRDSSSAWNLPYSKQSNYASQRASALRLILEYLGECVFLCHILYNQSIQIMYVHMVFVLQLILAQTSLI